jgi:hypothetical protein
MLAMMKKVAIYAACLVAVGLVAWAVNSSDDSIVYVDATSGASGNTVTALQPTGPVGDGTVWEPVEPDAVDGQWRARTGLGIPPTVTAPPSGVGLATFDGTVFESGGNSGGDDAPRLKTTVNGLAQGTYNVYVYFWIDQNGSPWRIRAGLHDSVAPLTLYEGSNLGATLGKESGKSEDGYLPVVIATDNFGGASTPPGRRLLQVLLGQTTGTSINVFVEDAPPKNGVERSWYDGIGYVPASPNP